MKNISSTVKVKAVKGVNKFKLQKEFRGDAYEQNDSKSFDRERSSNERSHLNKENIQI